MDVLAIDLQTIQEHQYIQIFGKRVIVLRDDLGLFIRYAGRRISLHKFSKFVCSDGLYRDGGKCPYCPRQFKSADGISQHTKVYHGSQHDKQIAHSH